MRRLACMGCIIMKGCIIMPPSPKASMGTMPLIFIAPAPPFCRLPPLCWAGEAGAEGEGGEQATLSRDAGVTYRNAAGRRRSCSSNSSTGRDQAAAQHA